MAKYTEAQLVKMAADGTAVSFVKKVQCYRVPGDADDVVFVADNGQTLSGRLVLKDENGVVYALADKAPFGSWWKKITGVAGGLKGILGSPLASFVAGFTGWPVAKLATKLGRVADTPASLIDSVVRDEIGSHKGGRIVLALEEAIKHGVATPDQAEQLGKLLGGSQG